MTSTKPTGPQGPETGVQPDSVPGLENMLRALTEAGGNRTRRERNGTETLLIRSVERVNLLLKRWHEIYSDQLNNNEPRLALISALELCAEHGVPLPDWVAWDIRDAAHSLLCDGVALNESLRVERLGKGRQEANILYQEQNALRLRLEVSCLVESGECATETAALTKLAKTPAFDNKSLSTLSRMLKMAKQNSRLHDRILKGLVVSYRHKG